MTDLSIEQLRSRARDTDEEPDANARLVAVLIMVVSVLAAGTAYLQAQAGRREATATRNAQVAAVAAMSSLVQSRGDFNRRSVTASFYSDLAWLSSYLSENAATNGAPEYTNALSRSYDSATRELQPKVNSLFERRYLLTEAGFDYNQFYEDQLKPGYKARETQKAAAEARDGWSSKGSSYVTVITIFAVSLFLLGLTLTVPSGARKPFLYIGTLVAGAAALWGILIFATPVDKPSPTAIDFYVNGAARLARAELEEERDQPRYYRDAARDLEKAIEIESDYRDAYIRRGSAYFNLDFLHPLGPQGSEDARRDWQRAVDLDRNDYLGWGDLGAAEFWLGHYRDALDANEHALDLRADNPFFNLNQALYLVVLDREDEYRKQLVTIRRNFSSIPTWLREAATRRYQTVFRLGKQYRPTIAAEVSRFEQDLLVIDHEITASLRLFGSPKAPRTDARVTELAFEPIVDRTALKARFSYTGLNPGDVWFYDTYVDGQKVDHLSTSPEAFSASGLPIPDGGAVITLPRADGWSTDTAVRLEVFVQANLLGTTDYRVR